MRELRNAVVALLVLTAVLGAAYPLAMTGVSQVAFGQKADGDPDLIGISYAKQPDLFQTRPSVTENNPRATFFNNQGPNQQALADQLKGFVRTYLRREGRYTPGLTAAKIPVDAVTTSASGVDPDISRANARIQANRVAARTGLATARVLRLIADNGRHGDAVDVVALNRAVKEASR
jgi:K+-transporting ATPase ATPase C chain